MNHQDAADQLNDYLDNELPTEKAREFEGHLNACPECAKSLDHLKKIRTALFNQNPPLSDRTFVSRLMDRLESETDEPVYSLGWRSWKLPAFSLGLAGLTFLLTLQTVRRSESINSVLFMEESNFSSAQSQPEYQSNEDDLLAQVVENP